MPAHRHGPRRRARPAADACAGRGHIRAGRSELRGVRDAARGGAAGRGGAGAAPGVHGRAPGGTRSGHGGAPMTPTVLIVDDSLTVRMDLHEAFEADGFATVLCATGAEARAAFETAGFDAAVLDVLLPDADGVDLLRELRGRPERAGTVTLLLSTEAEIADRLLGLRTGADEYVGKPYDAGYVVARTRQLLGEAQHRPDGRALVLVIDDSATFRERLREMLEAEGYAVLTAASGEEGLRVAAERRPQAVIVDGVMPGMD